MDVILSQPRRRWPEDEKIAAVAMTFEPGMTVTGVARSLDITPSMLFAWRKKYRDGLGFPSKQPAEAPSEATSFMPVAVEAPIPVLEESDTARPCEGSPGVIEVKFGRSPSVKITGAVDTGVASAVMRALDRR